MAEYRQEFRSAYSSVAPARHAVVKFAERWLSGESLDDVEFAVGEALANCAEHGHRDGGKIDVYCRCDGQKLTIDVADTGSGFPRWNATDHLRPLANSPRGYGTFIMRELMDRVEYSDHGTHLRLTKYLPAHCAGATPMHDNNREA